MATDAIIGQIEPVIPHKCEPGRYVDADGSWRYANKAEPGTLWRCSCGRIYVKEYLTYGGDLADFITDNGHWRRLGWLERRKAVRELERPR